MQIIKKYLEELKPLVENVRKHNPAQLTLPMPKGRGFLVR